VDVGDVDSGVTYPKNTVATFHKIDDLVITQAIAKKVNDRTIMTRRGIWTNCLL